VDGRAKPDHDEVETTAPLVPYFNVHADQAWAQASAGHFCFTMLIQAKARMPSLRPTGITDPALIILDQAA
jgi:hypothetical protein